MVGGTVWSKRELKHKNGKILRKGTRGTVTGWKDEGRNIIKVLVHFEGEDVERQVGHEQNAH